jgi:hypothetical protein
MHVVFELSKTDVTLKAQKTSDFARFVIVIYAQPVGVTSIALTPADSATPSLAFEHLCVLVESDSVGAKKVSDVLLVFGEIPAFATISAPPVALRSVIGQPFVPVTQALRFVVFCVAGNAP